MNEHTSVIVYRNPMEQYMWESGLAYTIIFGIAVAGITAFVTNWLCEQYNVRYGTRWISGLSNTQTNLVIASGIVTMLATVWFFS